MDIAVVTGTAWREGPREVAGTVRASALPALLGPDASVIVVHSASMGRGWEDDLIGAVRRAAADARRHPAGKPTVAAPGGGPRIPTSSLADVAPDLDFSAWRSLVLSVCDEETPEVTP